MQVASQHKLLLLENGNTVIPFGLLPTSTLGTLLDLESLRIALALRVGTNVLSPICADVVGESMRGFFTGSPASSVLGDIQDMRH